MQSDMNKNNAKISQGPPSVEFLLSKTLTDVKQCIRELKQESEDGGGYPLTDDSSTLNRLCSKLELLLQIGFKGKTAFLGIKKDYFNYMVETLNSNKCLNDGLRFVKSLSELKTNLGRGRALIRFSLVHHRLADTFQSCLLNPQSIKNWYTEKSIFCQTSLAEELTSALYDLNSIQFDLDPRNCDLDTAWPTFSNKRSFGGNFSWKPPSRSNSIASLSSLPNLEIFPNLSTSLPPDVDEEPSFYQDSFMSVEDNSSMIEKQMNLEKEEFQRQLNLEKEEFQRQLNLEKEEFQRLLNQEKEFQRQLNLEKEEFQRQLNLEKEEFQRLLNLEKEEFQRQLKEMQEKYNESRDMLESVQKQLREKELIISEKNELLEKFKSDADQQILELGDRLKMLQMEKENLNPNSESVDESESRRDLELPETNTESEGPYLTTIASLQQQLVEAVSIKETISQELSQQLVKYSALEQTISEFQAKEFENQQLRCDFDALLGKHSVLEQKISVFEASQVEYLQMEEDLKNLREEHSLLEQKNSELVKEKELDHHQMENELRELREKHSIHGNTISEFEAKESVYQQMEKDLKALHEDMNSLRLKRKEDGFFERAYEELLKDKSECEENVKCLTDANDALESKIKEMLDAENKTKRLFVQLEETKRVDDEKISDLTNTISSLKKEIEDLGKEKEMNESLKTQLRSEVLVYQQQMVELEREKKVECEKFQTSESTLQVELQQLLAKEKEYERNRNEKDELLGVLRLKNESLEEVLRKNEEEHTSLQTEISGLKNVILETGIKLDMNIQCLDEKEKLIAELKLEVDEKENRLLQLKNETDCLAKEQDKLIAELRQDVEVISGSVQRREKLWESARESMEKNIMALQFDLSTKSGIYKARIKELEEKIATGETLARLDEQSVTIEKLQQSLDAMKFEQEVEQERAREQLDDLKQCLGSTEQENFSLRNQLTEFNDALKEKETNTYAERCEWEMERATMESDIKSLKKRVVQLLRDKVKLWEKSDQLKSRQEMQASYHWMNSSTVTNCTQCNAEFSVALRKHHCRKCGRVMCWTCCNNWLLTPHSSYKERVCNGCVQESSQAAATSECEDGSESDGDVADADAESNTSRDLPSLDLLLNTSVGSLQSTTLNDQDETAAGEDNSLPVESSKEGNWKMVKGAKAAASWVATATTSLASIVLPGSHSSNHARKNKDDSPKSTWYQSSTASAENEQQINDRSINSDSASKDEIFDLITPEEVSESILYPLPDPNTICRPIITLQDFEEGEILNNEDLWINAGKTYAIPVHIDAFGWMLRWQFSTQPKGITFSVCYKESDIIPYENCESILPSTKVNSHRQEAQGDLTANKVGVYTLLFDNSSSRFTAKKLTYKLQIMKTNESNRDAFSTNQPDSHTIILD